MQVYLPEDLYALVKKARLPASELLQGAVREELRRRELLRETDEYLGRLAAEVGRPSPRQRRRAEALAARLTQRVRKKAG
jgi:hypothetical protein